MNRYAHQCRPQNATVKQIRGLKDFQNRAVVMFGGFSAIHGLVHVGIKRPTQGFDAVHTQPGQIIQKLFVDEFEASPVASVLIFLVRSKGVLKSIHNGDQRLDNTRRGSSGILRALFFDALAVIIEVGLAPQQRLLQVCEFSRKFLHLRILPGRVCGLRFLGLPRAFIRGIVHFDFLLAHKSILKKCSVLPFSPRMLQPGEIRYSIFCKASLNSWATYATAVMARS